MSIANVDVHRVTRISVTTNTVAPHGPIQERYVVHNAVIYCLDNQGNPQEVRLTLFGDFGLAEVPFSFEMGEGL